MERNNTNSVLEEARSTPIVQSDTTASAFVRRSNTSLNARSESHSSNDTDSSKRRWSKSAPISRVVSKASLVGGIRGAKAFNRSKRPVQSEVEELRQQLDAAEKEKSRLLEELDRASRVTGSRAYRAKLAQGEIDDLRHELDEAHQRIKESTACCDKLIQEAKITKEQLHRVEALHELTRQQSIERTTELQSAQLFVNQADSLSGADIIGIAGELNAEILQVTALMADSLEYADGKEKFADETKMWSTVNRMIGEGLAELLRDQRPLLGKDPTVVQLALQVCIVHCANEIIDSWTLGGDDSCLSDVYRGILENEKQAAAGRWRSMTQLYATKPSGRVASQEIIASGVKVVLEAVGAKYQVHWDEFLKKLSNINTLALSLRTAIGQKVTSMDIYPFKVKFGTAFNPNEMEDMYANRRREEASKDVEMDESVGGSTELGLLCREKSVDGNNQKTIMLKSKVVLRSTLAENNL